MFSWYKRGPARGTLKESFVMPKGRPNRMRRSYLNRRLSRIERKLKAAEMKTKDTSVSTAVTTIGSVQCLNLIAQGDESVQREGLKINAVKLWGFLRYNNNKDDSVSGGQHIRTIIFMDRDCNGALPAVSDVLESASAVALPKHENRNRFKILYDRNVHMIERVSGLTSYYYRKIFIRFPKKGQTIYYDGTTAAIASNTRNALFVLFIATGDGINDPAVVGDLRLRYYG